MPTAKELLVSIASKSDSDVAAMCTIMGWGQSELDLIAEIRTGMVKDADKDKRDAERKERAAAFDLIAPQAATIGKLHSHPRVCVTRKVKFTADQGWVVTRRIVPESLDLDDAAMVDELDAQCPGVPAGTCFSIDANGAIELAHLTGMGGGGGSSADDIKVEIGGATYPSAQQAAVALGCFKDGANHVKSVGKYAHDSGVTVIFHGDVGGDALSAMHYKPEVTVIRTDGTEWHGIAKSSN